MVVLSIIRYSKSGSSAIALKHAIPDALVAPPAEPSEHVVPLTEHLWEVTPWRARSHDPQHALDRLSRPDVPRLRSSPMTCGAIRDHAVSLNT
jgi:hypothetical protein